MTNEEAKAIILSDADFSGIGEKAKLTADALCMAIEALERQIPKPKHKYGGYRCVCGEEVAKNQAYCEYCGQRLLDWSGDEKCVKNI